MMIVRRLAVSLLPGRGLLAQLQRHTQNQSVHSFAIKSFSYHFAVSRPRDRERKAVVTDIFWKPSSAGHLLLVQLLQGVGCRRRSPSAVRLLLMMRLLLLLLQLQLQLSLFKTNQRNNTHCPVSELRCK
jgi:hypothetical protein